MNRKLLKILSVLLIALFFGCSISPGMREPSGSWIGSERVYLENYGNEYISIQHINSSLINSNKYKSNARFEYTISAGDILTIIIWGQPEVFPIIPLQPNDPQSSRTVGNDGTIFFPYIGKVKVEGLTVSESRNLIAKLLSEDFIEPQVDVTITHFNAQRNIYVVGEITQYNSLVLGIEPISLSDAIVRSGGIKQNTSKGDAVYVIRQPTEKMGPQIFRANLSSPEEFIAAGQFYLEPRDIIYVGAADVTKWNRVISQFFPFASFINQIDNIED